MKKSSTRVLQFVLVLLGLAVFVFMLWEPTIEGRNVHATFSQIYFHDPFLVCAYTASIAFFVGLYQGIKLLGLIGNNAVFSQKGIRALRTIRYCAAILVAFALAGESYLFVIRPGDDIAGGVFMGLLVIAFSGVIAVAASVFEKTLERAVDMKSENDLTV